MTNLDQTGRERLAPRPVSRPPVDPASRRAFGRPDGVSGSFLGLDKYRDQGEYTPKDQPPDPVLAEAFGRPVRRRRLAAASPRRRRRAGRRARRAGRRRTRRPVAQSRRRRGAGHPGVAPARTRARDRQRRASSACATCCSAARCPTSRWRCCGIVALVIGFAGGWVGRKTAEVVEAFTTSKVTLETSDNGRAAGRAGSPKWLPRWLIRW